MKFGVSRRFLFLALFTAAGCSRLPAPATASVSPPASPAPASLPTGAAPATPMSAQARLAENLDQVSEERLIRDVNALSAIPTRHVNSSGISIAADYIAAGFAESGAEVMQDGFPFEFRGVATEQRNVVAVIPGTDPSAGAILLGAHYDSRTADIADGVSLAPGANDNATGVAVLLEVARQLADVEPRATIYLVAFAAEETGLQGSRHFVDTGQAPDVRAMIAFDIVGNSSGATGSSGLRVFSAGPEDSASRALARWLARVGAGWTPQLPVLVQDALDRPGRYSDHVPFSEAGIPSVRLIEDEEHTELQHSALDTADRIDPTYLRRVAQFALAITVELAAHPDTFH